MKVYLGLYKPRCFNLIHGSKQNAEAYRRLDKTDYVNVICKQ